MYICIHILGSSARFGTHGALVGQALVAPPRPLWALLGLVGSALVGPLGPCGPPWAWAALGPCGPPVGPCGPPWALLDPCGVLGAPPGPYGLGPCEPGPWCAGPLWAWSLVGRALVGLGPYGPGPCGPGPLWARPLWGPLGPHGPGPNRGPLGTPRAFPRTPYASWGLVGNTTPDIGLYITHIYVYIYIHIYMYIYTCIYICIYDPTPDARGSPSPPSGMVPLLRVKNVRKTSRK